MTKLRKVAVPKAKTTVNFEREVFTLLFDPINLVMAPNHPGFGWSFTIKNHRDLILVGSDKALDVDKRPAYGTRFSDMRLSISVLRRGNRLYEVRSLYGRSRAGWSSKPFVRVEHPFVLEPKLVSR
jgi:hypothetical protein